MMKFNEERTFGVEIEITTHVNRELILWQMERHGVISEIENWNHVTRNHWKITTDSSCGYEIVSPILKGRNGLLELKRVCDALNAAGCKVDKSCGLHVHHYAGDFTLKTFQRLMILYTKYEKCIDKVMPPSRRGNRNTYCQTNLKNTWPYRFGGFDDAFGNFMDKVKKTKSISDMVEVTGTRYSKLNFKAYVTHGTVEFRQHNGSINFEKISNWVKLTQAMVEKCIESRVSSNFTSNEGIGHLLAALGMLRKDTCSPEYYEMRRWFVKRERHFERRAQ